MRAVVIDYSQKVPGSRVRIGCSQTSSTKNAAMISPAMSRRLLHHGRMLAKTWVVALLGGC